MNIGVDKMVSTLHEFIFYIAKDIPFILNKYIREYDMSKANISVLLQAGAISKELYDTLYNAPRMVRQCTIGDMELRDPNITKIKKDGIAYYKKLFFESNDIQDQDVLSIKNDAIFLINKIPTVTQFDDYINFKFKNEYTSYYNLNGIELYYYYHRINQNEYISVKGINDSRLVLHANYFLEFLLAIFQTAQIEPIKDVIEFGNKFYQEYINMNLDVNFYRNFDSESKFKIKRMSNVFNYSLDFVDNKNKYAIDGTWNQKLIMQLMSYYSAIYFSTK